MKTKHYLFILLAALALATGCYDDDKLWKALNEQQQRIEALEAWQKTANSNIEALQALVSGKHFIMDVTPVVLAGDTTGYTIAFHDRTPVTIYNGTKGDKGDKGEPGATPAISLTQQEDSNWYWTLNGTLIKDAAGQPIRANGEDGKPATAPVLKTGQALTDAGTPGTWTADAVYLSVDAGKTWAKVSGIQGPAGPQGDAVFAPDGVAVDKQAGYVTFTLADKVTTFRLPLYGATVIRFENNRILAVDPTDGARVFLFLPDGFPKSDYGALMAEVVTASDGNSGIVTRGTSNNWTVKLEPPVFHPDNGNIEDPYVDITPPQGINLNTKALLRVTLIHADGHESTVSRVLLVTEDIVYDYTLEEQLTEPGEKPFLEASSTNSAYNPYLIKSAEHLQWIKQNPKKNNYYKLMRNIQITGSDSRGNWVPIGDYSNPFQGYFDGNDKNISGNIVAPADANYFGFFGRCENAEIRNLHYTGSMDLSKIIDVWSDIGAIVGYMYYGMIKHCSNSADLKCSRGSSMGGIVGLCTGAYNTISIEACVNTGCIVSASKAGGIAGKLSLSLAVGCINKGDIEGGGDLSYVGGIAGELIRATSKACWSTAQSLTHRNNGPVGGIAGDLSYSTSQVAICCWKELSGVAGIGKVDTTVTNPPTDGLYRSFSGDHPTAEEIRQMNEAWKTQNPSREYRFNADTGEIEPGN